MISTVRGQYVLLFLGLLMLGNSACVPPDPFHTLTGTWHLIQYENGHTGEVQHEPDDLPRAVIVSFDDQGKRGSFTAETPTNQLRGTYQIENDGDMETTEVEGTLFGEPEWSEGLWEALQTAKRYRITGQMMEIYYEDGLQRMIFERLGN
ncbi:MAG: hypothetical protein AAF587_21445 [Bacteroidota bacterium]